MNSCGSREPGKMDAGDYKETLNSKLRLVIAGAGTGGHLFPGIAVAEELMRRTPGSRVLFITTGRPVERTVLADRPFETAEISAAGFKGMGMLKKLGAVAMLPKGMFRSFFLLRRFSADAVLGMGAYSSAPVIAAAYLAGIPRFIHEQNRIAGMSNRWLSRLADLVFVSFEDTEVGLSAEKIVFTGNPVRLGIRSCAENRLQRRKQEAEALFNVLVLGGSQGAHGINTALIDSLSYLGEPRNFNFIHQTGPADEDMVKRAYESMGVQSEVSAFFSDMAPLYNMADLAICRAGATTVAEISAVGLPALLIPFPYAAEDHQTANAESLASAGAAEIIPEKELSGRLLAERLEACRRNPEWFEKLRAAAEAAGPSDSAGAILDQIEKITAGKDRRSRRAR